MATHFNKPVWTYEDYCVLPQDFNRHEIIEGDHVVTPSPTSRHQKALTRLLFVLDSHIQAHSLGELIVAPIDVLLAPTSVVQPDLLFIARERLSIIGEANIQGAPDLVVEVLSPSTEALDRGAKMALYAKYGVPHYWILDASRLRLEIYELEDEEYRLTGQFSEKQQAVSALFPGLVIPVDRLA
ncbi:MAG: Uma2 family endonuclease [Acidobacteria bacterium]|nr:Uma2 family endonuclease [Acidobacteriota bacterium]